MKFASAIFFVCGAVALPAEEAMAMATPRGTMFAAVPEPPKEPQCSNCLSPTCNWDTEEYRFDGKRGECVLVRGKEKPTWYSLEEGTCHIAGGNATHLQFDLRARFGIAFTSIPYKLVLDPHEQVAFSNLSNFEDQQVALLVRRAGANQEDILHLGALRVASDGSGVLVGERLHGVDRVENTGEYPCVLGSVQQQNAYSAVGVGTCTIDGEGGIDIDIDYAKPFKASRVNTLFPLEFFDGTNAAIFSATGGYDVITIDHANRTRLSGQAHFSTRVGTWTTPLGPGTEVADKCFIFIDDKAVKTTDEIHQAMRDHCRGDMDCTGPDWLVGSKCLREGCKCFTWDTDCGEGLVCEFVEQASSPLNELGNMVKAQNPITAPLNGLIGGFSAWVTGGFRVCMPYTTADTVANIIVAVADVAIAGVLIGAAAGVIGGAGASLAISPAELLAWASESSEEVGSWTDASMSAQDLFAWVGVS